MIVLYRELAGYFVNTMNYIADHHQVAIDILAYPVKSDAPFRFEFSKNIRVMDRREASLPALQELGKYDLIFCGGWSDDLYLKYVKVNHEVPSLLGFDKQWLGSFRDRASVIYLRWFVRNYFDFAFVPGAEQVEFARRMGFSEANVYSGAYTCEVSLLSRVYEAGKRNEEHPYRIIYTGRYAPEKQIETLWSVFSSLSDDFPGWELHCAGTGPLWESRTHHPKIFHHGFLQGEELHTWMKKGGIFVLPSAYEPWGVVVNEFATAGYPLILSDRVGARTGLLTPANGWQFPHQDADALRKCLKEAMNTDPEKLKRMGEESHRLGIRLDERQYADSILRMMASA